MHVISFSVENVIPLLPVNILYNFGVELVAFFYQFIQHLSSVSFHI